MKLTRALLPSLLLAILATALLPGTAGAATERVRIWWNTATDIDLHVYDEAGVHEYYGAPDAIPNTTLSTDNTVGYGPESFTDDEDPGTARTFHIVACYYDDPNGAGPTTVSGTITDGGGETRAVSEELDGTGDCVDLGVSRGAPATPTPEPSPSPEPSPTPEPNHAPVAANDHWDVPAGGYVYENVLANDRDPDGDAITPHVTSISFDHHEWSGMERTGRFNYTSGPGTRVHQRKVVSYYLTDARGARSAPAKLTIDVIPPGRKRTHSPVRRRGHASASQVYRWYSNPTLLYSCFGAGFDTKCFGVFSPPQVVAINAATPWVSRPSAAEATKACYKAFARGGVQKCVTGLLSGPLFRAGDKQIIRIAAQSGYCLLFRQDLNRTLRHPVAGEWTKPEYHQIHSFLAQGQWGTWSRGLTGSWQVPVSCTANAAWKYFPRSLVAR